MKNMFYLENKFQKLDSAVNCDISKVNLPLLGENSVLNFPVIKKNVNPSFSSEILFFTSDVSNFQWLTCHV